MLLLLIILDILVWMRDNDFRRGIVAPELYLTKASALEGEKITSPLSGISENYRNTRFLVGLNLYAKEYSLDFYGKFADVLPSLE